MPKKILLIENDSAFASELTQSLEPAGFDVRVTADGKEGLDLAREWGPEAIVLCVELPGMSGYLVCQKLRKDDAVKGIPLVLTSAEATEDTFEKHRALKVRADEYLLKPYAPSALLEKLGALVGLPEDAGAPLEEELVSLEEEMGLEALPSEPEGELPALDLQSLPDDGLADPAAGADEALALLDDAFDGLTAPSRDEPLPPEGGLELELDGERAGPVDDLDARAAALEADEPLPPSTGFGSLDDADAALGALGDLGEDEPLTLDPPAPPPVRGASADLLRAAGIKLLDDPPAAPRAPAPPARAEAASPRPPAPPPSRGDAASQAAIDRLERDLAEAQQELAEARGVATGREAELRQLRARADEASRRADAAEAALEKARRAEADARAAREAATRAEAALEAARRSEAELRERLAATEQRADEATRRLQEVEARAEEAEVRAEDALAEARRKADELELATEAVARSESLERQLDEARAELVAARGEADGARGEVEQKTVELRKRVADLEALTAKHEERVLKAYQKIKNDEKVKEKVRKAIAIAAQLLDEGLPPAPDPEKARAAAAASALLGRDS